MGKQIVIFQPIIALVDMGVSDWGFPAKISVIFCVFVLRIHLTLFPEKFSHVLYGVVDMSKRPSLRGSDHAFPQKFLASFVFLWMFIYCSTHHQLLKLVPHGVK